MICIVGDAAVVFPLVLMVGAHAAQSLFVRDVLYHTHAAFLGGHGAF